VKNDRGWTSLHVSCAVAGIDLVQQLVAAGATLNSPDYSGLTPIQWSQHYRKDDVAKVIQGRLVRDAPTFTLNPPLSRWNYLQTFAGQDPLYCGCERCLLIIAICSVGQGLTGDGKCCLCLNHVRVFVKDTLSDVYQSPSCPCSGCLKAREYNTKETPCGTPTSTDYLSCNDNPKRLSQAAALFTEPPTLLSPAAFIDKPLPPYPGHEYYDRIIDRELQDYASKVTHPDMAASALKCLADAGFKGSKSYRKQPHKALEWVVLHYKDLTHVTKIIEILLACNKSMLYSVGGDLLQLASESQNIPLMSLLIDTRSGIGNIWRRAVWGLQDPLETAASHGQVLSARILLRAGADVNHRITKLSKRTPLYSAVAGNGDRLKRIHTVMALLESGADIEATNGDNGRPLKAALDTRDPEMITTLLQYGADVHKSCGLAPCALFYALWKGTGDIVRLLLEEYGAESDVGKVSSRGDTALHCRASPSIKDIGVINLLFGYGLKVDAEDKQGGTALHDAACSGNTVMAKKLLEHGATMHLQNHAGKTALDVALKEKNWEVVECLGGRKKSRWWR
jgi:ankyrin repeat protein